MYVLSLGGLILDKTITDSNLGGAVVYTPVINGQWRNEHLKWFVSQTELFKFQLGASDFGSFDFILRNK